MESWHRVGFAIALLVGGVALTPAAAQDRYLAPTPLEAFAAQPDTTLTWSRTIGELESASARATVDAVIYQNPDATPLVMRGLRISLIHLVTPTATDCELIFLSHAVLCSRADAAIFFLESEFSRVKAGLGRGNAENNLIISFGKGGSGWRVTGIIVGGYEFGGTQPDDLIRIIDRAAAALEDAPR